MSARRRIQITTAALVTASAVALTGPAGALVPQTVALGGSEGVRYKKQTMPIPGSGSLQPTKAVASPACDQGWKAVSGGQTIAARGQHKIADSEMTDDRLWYSSAWQRHDVERPLVGYAVCLRTTKLSVPNASEFDIPADSQVTDAAMCTSGYAVGGGVQAIGDKHDFALNASYPIDSGADADTVPDNGWRSYHHYSGSGGDDAVYSAMCLAGPRPAYRTTTVDVPAEASVQAQAVCPKDRPVIGGGVYATGEASRSHVVTSRPWDGKDSGTVPDDGWRGGIYNDSGGDLAMTVHAICR